MSFPIQSSPGDKRVSYEQGPVARRRLHSEEGSNSLTSFADMPLEICALVASYLQEDDLKALAQFSSKCKTATLSEKNIQEMQLAKQELKVLNQLNPVPQIQGFSAIDTYKEFVLNILHEDTQEELPGVVIRLDALERLQQALTALATKQAADQILIESYKCYELINQNQATFENIEDIYRIKKEHLVAEAMHYIIEATMDPQSTRGQALYSAAENGHLRIVQTLLSAGPISEVDRSASIEKAADHGHLDIVEVLLTSRAFVSDQDLAALALWQAARNGRIDQMQHLLESAAISAEFIGWIVKDAAIGAPLKILQVLLSGDRHSHHREWAISQAAIHNRLDVVQALLAEGEISEYFRGQSVMNAALYGNIDVVQELLANGPISDLFFAQAIVSAAIQGSVPLLEALLVKNNSISEPHRAFALIEAASRGHFEFVKALSEKGMISASNREAASRVAHDSGYEEVAAFLRQS